jgi:hypothetical protein
VTENSCIASSSADCVFGGVRLISSASEQRALHERPGTAPRALILFEDVRARDVGRHQVWRELNALEREPERASESSHEQRLGGARHTGDQAVAADEQRHQQVLDDLVLADDDLADLLANLLERRLEGLDQRPCLLRLELVFCAQRTTSSSNCWASR